MKERLTKELEELNKQKKIHTRNYNELTAARDKCVATLNGTLGAIEVIEKLLKEITDKEQKDKK